MIKKEERKLNNNYGFKNCVKCGKEIFTHLTNKKPVCQECQDKRRKEYFKNYKLKMLECQK